MPPHRNQRLPLHERIKDGRVFAVSKRAKNGVIYLRCQTKCCYATATKHRNGEIVSSRKHSAVCFEDRMCQAKADFMHALKSALQRNFWRLKVLYETIAELYPREIKVLLPYNSIKSTLKRWRSGMYPSNPSGLEEMAAQLEQPENSRLLEYDVGRLQSRKIIDSLGNVHVLMYDPQFVANEFRNVTRLFIDGTFQTTPTLRDVYQLVTILGVTYDHALPFAHILMSSKTEAAYTAVFTEIATLINSAGVKIVMADFEQALRNACKQVFSSAHVAGCSVHYDRALLRKMKKLHLTATIREDEDAKLFMKKLMALAYLPCDSIQTEYEALKAALPEALATTLQRFLNYYERQWLRIITPAGFSVHGLSRRTNNVTECYNSVLADKLGKHPGAWTFLVSLLKLTSNARDDLQSLKLGKRIKRYPRYSTVYKRNQLVKAWKQLYSDEISAAEFLSIAAFLKGHIRQRLHLIADDLPEDEVEMEETPNIIPAEEDPDFDIDLFRGLRFDDGDLEEPINFDNHETDMDMGNSSVGSGNEEDDDHVDVLPRNFEAPDELQALDEDEAPDELEALDEDEAPDELQALDEDEAPDELEALDEDEAPDELEALDEDEAPERLEVSQQLEAREQLAASQLRELRQLREAWQLRETREQERALQADLRQAREQREVRERNEGVIDIIEDSDSDDLHEEEGNRGGRENVGVDQVVDLTADSDNDVATEPAENSRTKASRNKKKNQRKKRRKQYKARNENTERQPNGHKRRRYKKSQTATTNGMPQANETPQGNETPQSATTNEDVNFKRCVVCKEEECTHIFIPCGHICSCAACAEAIVKYNIKTCPKCREPYRDLVLVYME